MVHAARKDADTHFQYDGASAEGQAPQSSNGSKHHDERASMYQHWGFGTPEPEKKIYKTAGDGMGGRAGPRTWGIGSESDPEEMEATANKRGRGRQHAQAGASNF